ncbi:hypothetical protein IJ096_02315 [Candidatus Saccharibacteria bacterium]|nr:hypothetical protein [Candidatus Saccharibacteria bacterium]
MLLFLGAGAVLLPELVNTSSALTCENGLVTNTAGTNMSLGDVCAQDSAGMNVNLPEVLSADLITVTPSNVDFGTLTSGTLSTRDVVLSVDTNVASGYNIQLNGVKTVTAATSALSNDLVGNASPYPTIKTFTSSATTENRTPATFEAGNWGYMVTTTGTGSSGTIAADALYNAIPASNASSSVKTARTYSWQYDSSTNSMALTKNTTFRFGVKPGENQAQGVYEGQVLFTIAPNA